jgi:imidazolonepropionase-like amidohydrolase
MRTPRTFPFPAASLFAASLLLPAVAQEPPPPPTPVPAPSTEAPKPDVPKPEAANPEAAQPADAKPDGEAPAEAEGQRRRRRPPLVIEAGTIHPVAGPAIADGVLVIRGDRILAIGKKGEVEIPPNAVVRSFPAAHVYPGLVDAMTDAFTDNALRNDGESDGGALFGEDLRNQNHRGDQLAAAGITTAYIAPRSPSLVRGQGAIVRPTKDGFEAWSGQGRAGLEVRMAAGPGSSHALQRQQQLTAVDQLFEGLDEFKKAQADHKEALTKYEKEFADYLAFHEKKKGDGKAGAPAADGKPAAAGGRPPAPTSGEAKVEEPPPPPSPEPPKKAPRSDDEDDAFAVAFARVLAALEQDPPKPEPKPQDPPKAERVPPGAPADPKAAGADKPSDKKDEGPKRPTYPKAPPKDPQKESLLQVLAGDLALRVEAHRPDELSAALRLQKERAVPQLIVEGAWAAAGHAPQLAAQGIAVVLTETLPVPMEAPFDRFDRTALPAKLEAAAVPFAIASGSAQRAALLPLIAAAAVGKGLSAAAALRALTLTPAEILGVAKDTGSLVAGKYADVLVVDRPLFQSDSRVLLVLGRGRTEFERK